MIFKITGGFLYALCILSVKIAALGSLKRFSERIFSNFKEVEFGFFINEETKIVKTLSTCTESTLPIQYYMPSKKYLSRGTIPLCVECFFAVLLVRNDLFYIPIQLFRSATLFKSTICLQKQAKGERRIHFKCVKLLHCRQCCGSWMLILDPNFFIPDPGSKRFWSGCLSENLSIFNPKKNVSNECSGMFIPDL
jgi:hypothetical protein